MGSRSHFEQLAPSTLRPYSLNKAVFGDMTQDLNPDFIAAVGRGIDNNTLTPCTVTSKHMILSGHRRIAAAIQLGKKLIPCQVVYEENFDVLNEIWADANRNREMTVEQRGRYYDALKDIEVKRGRMNPDSDSALKSAPMDGQEKKDSRQSAADAAGFGSHYKAETVSKVVKAIDKLEEQGKPEQAAELREVLETKPAAAALRAAVEVLPPKPAKPRKPRPEKPAIEADQTEDGDDASEDSPPEECKDSAGKPIPSHLVPVFEKRNLFNSVLARLSQLQASYNELVSEENDELTHKLNKTQSRNDLKNFKQQIQFAIPYATCPYCKGTGQAKGAGCQCCKGAGWVVKSAYEAAPETMR